MTRIKPAYFTIKKARTLFKTGRDSTELQEVTVLHLSFKQKKSYLYVTSQGEIMSGAFGNNWKWQTTELNYDSSKIWNYIKSLDRKNYICLNDIHDKVNTKYEAFWGRFDDNKLNLKEKQLAKSLTEDRNIIDFSTSYGTFSDKQCLSVAFIEMINNNISELQQIAWNQKWNDHELLLQSILFIILIDYQFFEKHILIDIEIIKKMKNSIALDTYHKCQQMKKLQLELNHKEYKKPLNKI
jgi:hypothetical protein